MTLSLLILAILISILVCAYIIDHKIKNNLLNNILSKNISFEKIWISDTDGDGYQNLYVANKDTIKQTLALHFDIQNTCNLLLKHSIAFTGQYQDSLDKK